MEKNILIKRLFFASCFLPLILTGCKQKPQNGFTVKGNISGLKDSVVYFSHESNNPVRPFMHTVKVSDGQFTFSGNAQSPLAYYLSAPSSGNDPHHTLIVFIENASIIINGTWDSLDKATIIGSKVQDDYNILQGQLSQVNHGFDSLNEIYNSYIKSNDTAGENKLRPAYDPFQDSMFAIQQRFIQSHPQSIVSAYLLNSFYGSRQSPEKRLKLLQALDTSVQHSYYGKKVAAQIHWDTLGFPGHPAMPFTSKTITGQTISLSDYRGKYVLLDFWASWCVPCRASNPHLQQIWEKYKDKNFEIIGIADNDEMTAKWKEAIEHDKVGEWPNILRGMGTNQDLDQFYSVHEIPTKILIDPSGMIILRCEDSTAALDQKLAAAFRSVKKK